MLFMDDEAYLRVAVEVTLLQLGYTPILADGGDSAVRQLRGAMAGGTLLAAAILDLTIPGGMGGEAVLKELREFDPSLPAIAVSGYSEDPIMAHPDQYGFSASIEKPFRQEDLAAILARVARKPEDEAEQK